MTRQPAKEGIIYRGNSVISVEALPDYPDPVVVKKPSSAHPSRRVIQSLERECQMGRALAEVKGVRQALGQQVIKNQPALILESIDGENLRDAIARETLSLRAKLEIAGELARILGSIHGRDILHIGRSKLEVERWTLTRI
jgi:tRNA A-37 threonylcarbamoyl transferase component Bud32